MSYLDEQMLRITVDTTNNWEERANAEALLYGLQLERQRQLQQQPDSYRQKDEWAYCEAPETIGSWLSKNGVRLFEVLLLSGLLWGFVFMAWPLKISLTQKLTLATLNVGEALFFVYLFGQRKIATIIYVCLLASWALILTEISLVQQTLTLVALSGGALLIVAHFKGWRKIITVAVGVPYIGLLFMEPLFTLCVTLSIIGIGTVYGFVYDFFQRFPRYALLFLLVYAAFFFISFDFALYLGCMCIVSGALLGTYSLARKAIAS